MKQTFSATRLKSWITYKPTTSYPGDRCEERGALCRSRATPGTTSQSSSHGQKASPKNGSETNGANVNIESTLVKAHLALAGSDELVHAEILDHTAEDMPSSNHKMRKPVQKKAPHRSPMWQQHKPDPLHTTGVAGMAGGLPVHHWRARERAKKYGLKVQDLTVSTGAYENLWIRAHRLVANRTATEYLGLARCYIRRASEHRQEAGQLPGSPPLKRAASVSEVHRRHMQDPTRPPCRHGAFCSFCHLPHVDHQPKAQHP